MSQHDELRDARKPGWFWIDNIVLELYLPVIGTTAFGVYAALAKRSRNGDHRVSWPSRETLAQDTGLSVRTVQSAINTLSDKDGALAKQGLAPLITVRQRNTSGGRTSNIYEVAHIPVSAKNDIGTESPSADFSSPSAENDDPKCSQLHSNKTNEPDQENETEGSAIALPAKAPTVHQARWALFVAYADALGLDGPERSARSGRSLNEIKKAFGARTLPSMSPEDFGALTAYAQSKVKGNYVVWPVDVLKRKREWEQASKPEQASGDVRAMAERYVAIVNDDRRPGAFRTPIPVEQAEAMFRRVADQIVPDDIEDMVLWRWKQKRKPPSTIDIWWMVRDWIDHGKPRARRANDSRWY